MHPAPPPQAEPWTPSSMPLPPSPPSCSSLNPRVIVSLFFTLHPRLRAVTHVLKWIGALTPPRSSPLDLPCVSQWPGPCFSALPGPLFSQIFASAEANLITLQEPLSTLNKT